MAFAEMERERAREGGKKISHVARQRPLQSSFIIIDILIQGIIYL